MKRLLLLVCLVVSATNPISAIGPVGSFAGFGLSQSPAYPILPSMSAILGGSACHNNGEMPTYCFDHSLSGGRICLDLNCNAHNDDTRYSFVAVNPDWDSGKIQMMTILENNDGSMYLSSAGTNVFQKEGYIVRTQVFEGRTKATAFTLEMKKVLELSADNYDTIWLYPLSKKHFLLRHKTYKIIDLSGKVVVEGELIFQAGDPWGRFWFVDGKLFDLERREFVPLPFDWLKELLEVKFENDYLEIVRQCDVSPPVKDCIPHIWRFSYKWELIQDYDVSYPFDSVYLNCYGVVGETMIFFDRSNTERCGWHFIDIKTKSTRLHLPCLGFTHIAVRYLQNGGRMIVPNPDGAWVIDLETMKLGKVAFPGRASIVKTDKGFFAITESEDDEFATGCLLDDNLKPIELTRTGIRKAQNYLAIKDKILSLAYESRPVYDAVARQNSNEYVLSIWCSIQGEGVPKRIGSFKFLSSVRFWKSLEYCVFDNNLYIPTGIAGFASIDLLSMKMKKFCNDEVDVKYGRKLSSTPAVSKTKMMTAFVYNKDMVFAYDSWMNLKIEQSIKPENAWHDQKIWVWWDKIVVGESEKTTIYRLDGTKKTLNGRAVSFSQGYLQLLVEEQPSHSKKLVGIDIDTEYERIIWSKISDDKIRYTYGKIGNEHHIGDRVFDLNGNLLQTGITGLVNLNVESGSASMTNSENGLKGCGNDYFITKWCPSPQYSIRRVFKNEFEICQTRGDGKSEPLSGRIYACRWGDGGYAPSMTRLYEVTQIGGMKYSETKRFKAKFPQNIFLSDAQNGDACFGLVFIGNGLLDTTRSELQDNDVTGRALFDGTPVDALKQKAVSVTVWKEQP